MSSLLDQLIIHSFVDDEMLSLNVQRRKILKSSGHFVHSLQELRSKVAELGFFNSQEVFLFKGQSVDDKNSQGLSSLRPSIFQPVVERGPSPVRLVKRMGTLREAEGYLFDLYKRENFPNLSEIGHHRLRRWAILEHYGVCRTPLLEVTKSLRMAASQATDLASERGYVYVLGVPAIAGAMTVDAKGELSIIRLSSVCPPPLINDATLHTFMLAEHHHLSDYEVNSTAMNFDVNFKHRVYAKFTFNPIEF